MQSNRELTPMNANGTELSTGNRASGAQPPKGEFGAPFRYLCFLLVGPGDFPGWTAPGKNPPIVLGFASISGWITERAGLRNNTK